MTELFKNLPDPTTNTSAVIEKTEAEKLAESVKPLVAAPIVQTPANPAVAPVTQSQPEPEVEEEDEEVIPVLDELAMLKKRADLMSIKYSNNIGTEALKAKINAKLEGEKDTTDEDGVALKVGDTVVTAQNLNQINPSPDVPTVAKPSPRQYMRDTQMKMVRLRITNLDPKKKDLPGEIITVANEYLGTVRKFVPFGEVTDGGYHVPYCIYTVLKERTFVSIKTRKGTRGQEIVENQDAREFSLEVLPPLTPTELAQLATAQQAKGGLENN